MQSRKEGAESSDYLLYHIPFIPFGWGLDTIQCDVAPESLLQDGGLTGACVAAVASPRPKMNVCRCQALYFVCNWLGQPLGLNRCLATGWLAGLLAGWRHLSPTVHHLPSTEAPLLLLHSATKKPKTFANLLFPMSDHFSYRRAVSKADDKRKRRRQRNTAGASQPKKKQKNKRRKSKTQRGKTEKT